MAGVSLTLLGGFELTLRPVPSGGALDELEYYPIIKDCRGIAPGLYRYDPAGHALEPIAGLTPDVAYLLREPRVDDVFAVARRGERMPQKSTYFFPKPLSGLLFHPLYP